MYIFNKKNCLYNYLTEKKTLNKNQIKFYYIKNLYDANILNFNLVKINQNKEKRNKR